MTFKRQGHRRLVTWRIPAALWLLSVALPAQEPAEPSGDADLRALIEKAGESKDNSGADVVTVFKRTAVKVEASGLARIESRELTKCLTEKGAAQLARLRFDYDPASNKIELRALRILRKGGAVADLPLDRGVDLPQPQYGIYWGQRMILHAVPRLQPGDAVEVKTSMKGFLIAYLGDLDSGNPARAGGPAAPAAQAAPAGAAAPGAPAEDDEKYIPPMRGHFYDIVTFQESWPVKLRHYSVTTPRDKPIQFEVYGGGVKSFAGFDADRLVYRFWLEDIPAFHSEPRAVAASDVQTKVVLATVPSWAEKSRWFARVNEAQFEADAAIRAKVAELTRGLSTDEDKVAAIVHWAADNIRYSGITMGKGEGYTLHPGPMIFRDRSGVCKDKAGMAITLLRAAGFTAYPAMTMAGSRVERIPADQFNHCVVALERKDGGFQMLDPTWVVFSPELWSSAEGEQHYLIGTPRGEELMNTPAFDPAKNEIDLESSAALDAEGNLEGTLKISGQGLADQRLRRELVHGVTSRDRQAWFERAIAGLGPGAAVEKVNVTYPELQTVLQPLLLEVRYKVPRYALAAGEQLFFAPPMSRHILRSAVFAPYLGLADLEKRAQPIQLGASRKLDIRETIALPAGFKAAHLPSDRSMDEKAASLTIRSEVKGEKLSYDCQLIIKRREVPVEDYEGFRRVMQEVEKLPGELAVLAR